MRADRLLSMMMLLQARGKLTAQEIAHELEISERTVYRDVDALSIAGVPIYTDRGPGGGIALLESYRTTLTGLTESERQALFILSIPAALVDLGMSDDLKAALRKIAAAVPGGLQSEHDLIEQRLFLDPTPWHARARPTPHLHTVHSAVREDRLLAITYRLPWSAQRERVVKPLGLVAKVTQWYLVCMWDENKHVIEVNHILAASMLDEGFERPADFDLEAFWAQSCALTEENQPCFEATVRISPALWEGLSAQDDGTIRTVEGPDDNGWMTVTLITAFFSQARQRILGWGRAAEVVEPPELRESVIDFAQQISNFYTNKAKTATD